MDDSSTDALESLEFLSSSPVRVRILDALAAEPATAQAIEAETGVPRSTLRRNLGELVDRGYVRRSAASGTYSLSAVGDAVRKTIRSTMATVADAEALAPFLEHFPESVPVSANALADCEVVGSGAAEPFEPVSAVRDRLRGSERVRGFVPVINPLYLKGLHAWVGDDRPFELVAPRSAYASRFDRSPDRLRDIAAASNVTLYESEAVPEYALGFLDDEVLLGAFDDHMRTHSVLFADHDAPVTEWANERYDAIRETAREFAVASVAD